MRNWWIRLAGTCLIATTCGTSSGWAQDVGASQSGNWNVGTTWTSGTVPGSSATVWIGSTYPGGSALSATVTLTQAESIGNVYLGNGSGTSGTLDLGGNKLTISGSLNIGQGGGVGHLTEGTGGSFTAQTANVSGSGNALNFGASDAVASLQLFSGASATTAGARNVTGGGNIYSGSTLNLGANLSLSSNLNVQDSGSTLNLDGHSLSANILYLGSGGASTVNFDRGGSGGTLALGGLFLANGQNLSLVAGDTIGGFNLSGNGTTLTTATTANITSSGNIEAGSTLNLGANLSLSSNLNVQDSGSTLNLDGHSLSANILYLGWNGTAAVSVGSPGMINLQNLYMGNGSSATLLGGVVQGLIDLQGNSVLTVQQTNGTGLTLNGSLTIDPSSIDLVFGTNTAPNWDFRWKDPSNGGNWISTIDAMIADHQIVITAPQGYQVVDQGGYTYINGFYSTSVPEPSTLVLGGLSLVGMLMASTWKRLRR